MKLFLMLLMLSYFCEIRFLDLYTRQSDENPIETLEELRNLGFDLHLDNTCFITVDDAIEAMLNESNFNKIDCDEELIRYAEQRVIECKMNSLFSLTVVCFSTLSYFNF
jgi:hypothetical protein